MRSQAKIFLTTLELDSKVVMAKNQRSKGLIIMIALLAIGQKV